ncbi:glycosyltransferase [soil metagenome]
MRIAYLTSQYPAASHTFIRREIESLREQGISIDTLSIRRPDAGEREDAIGAKAFQETFYVLATPLSIFLKVHFAGLFLKPASYLKTLRLAINHRAPGLRALVWALFHFAEAIVVADHLRRNRIDHLHNHFGNAAANVGLLASRFLGMPWSLTLHGISETDYPAGLLLGRKIAAAKFVACVSWFGRAQAMRITDPQYWSKFVIVRCGIDLSALPASRAARQQQIICVGRLSPEKGQLGLLESFAKIRVSEPNAELVLVGDGPDRVEIERRSAALDLENAVTFAGRLDEAATLDRIAQADLLVLPSFMEGLPVVLIEAMALGVPVIASHVAGIPELIEDGDEGLLFRPGDWDDLAAKVTRLLSDEVLRKRVSSGARAKVAREFQISNAVTPLIDRFSGQQ